MIKGLDKFKAHFAQHTKSFVLIGALLVMSGLRLRVWNSALPGIST